VTGSIPLAVIGGSGFYDMPGLGAIEEVEVDTPFGRPSDAIRIGMLEGTRVAFLARHGRGHRLLPSELPQRANFWALKELGVERVVSISAVGSLRGDYEPGHMVTPDQLIDRTNGGRPATFFGNGVVAHIAFAEPFCPAMRAAAAAGAVAAGATVHRSGTYVVIEGPAFGTRAEGELQRGWGASIVGMTALPEAKLAREAELCYATLAAVTDYDAGHAGHEAVDARTVFETLRQNVATAQEAVRNLARSLPGREACGCSRALDAALVTAPEMIDEENRRRLGPILARRLGVTG
jgi:5'-methylthioadenosine phosphorylase